MNVILVNNKLVKTIVIGILNNYFPTYNVLDIHMVFILIIIYTVEVNRTHCLGKYEKLLALYVYCDSQGFNRLLAVKFSRREKLWLLNSAHFQIWMSKEIQALKIWAFYSLFSFPKATSK